MYIYAYIDGVRFWGGFFNVLIFPELFQAETNLVLCALLSFQLPAIVIENQFRFQHFLKLLESQFYSAALCLGHLLGRSQAQIQSLSLRAS